ncbi:FRAS1-related extracellular matrix protein 2-like [Osmerus eperlanus]|uniref:FRAS1-related extracellular matrix protein 2-like n=1 Tax=Osmerus eperlanus TaxID=29151 RepID=UPI002E11A16B
MGFGEDSDAAFTEGSVIYGRVMVDPVHRLGNHFLCHIRQVFLCTPAHGYVPKYRPGNHEYGCLADSPSLLYRLKLLDKAQPESQALEFGGVRFQALLAGDTPGAEALVSQPDADGFSLSSDPLFQEGQEWYIHVVYTVHSSSHGNSYHGISKRSLHQHSAISRGRGSRAALEDNQDQGTNLQYVPLRRAPLLGHSRVEESLEGLELQEKRDPAGEGSPEIEASAGIGWLAVVVVVVVVVCVGGLGLYLRGQVRSEEEQEKHPGNHSSSSCCSAFQGRGEGRSWRTRGGVSAGSSEV